MKLSLQGKSRIPLMDFSVAFYIASIVLANGTIIFYVAAALLAACGFLALNYRRITANRYIIMMGAFILFHGLLILTGVTEYPRVSTNRLAIMVLNFLLSYFLYCYFLDEGSREKGKKYYIFFTLVLIAYGCATNMHAIFDGRFGDSTPYPLGLTGVHGLVMNSNEVGRILNVALFLAILGAKRENKVKTVVLAIVFTGFSALTGSRGALLISVGFLLVYFFLISRSISKKISYIIVALLAVILAYYLIMNVPVLYDIIGQRFEVLLAGAFGNRNYSASGDGDSSYHRMLMIRTAWKFFKEKPLLGWGLFAYSQMDAVGTYTHSNVMEMLVSGGAVGFVLYYESFIWMMIKSFQKRHGKMRKVAIACFSVLLVATVMSMVSMDFNSRNAIFHYTFIAASIQGILNSGDENTLSRRDGREKEEGI